MEHSQETYQLVRCYVTKILLMVRVFPRYALPKKLCEPQTVFHFHHGARRGDNYAMSAKMLLKRVLAPIPPSSHRHVPRSTGCSTQCSTCFMPYLCDFFSRAFLFSSLCGTFQTIRDSARKKGLFGHRAHEKAEKTGERERGRKSCVSSPRNLSHD